MFVGLGVILDKFFGVFFILFVLLFKLLVFNLVLFNIDEFFFDDREK